MNVREQKIKAVLRQNKVPQIDPAKRKQTIDFISYQMLQTTMSAKKSYLQRVWEQMAYIAPITWGMQFTLLLSLVCLMRFVDREISIATLSMLAPLIGLIGFSEILRSFSYNMWELEQTCCYNLKQLIGIKMLILGMTDFLIIGGMIAAMGEKQTNISISIMFVLIPFNIANAVYLFILKAINRRCSNYVLLGVGVVMTVIVSWLRSFVFMDAKMCMMLSSPKLAILSSIISLALTGFIGYQFLNELNKEEKLKWNFE